VKIICFAFSKFSQQMQQCGGTFPIRIRIRLPQFHTRSIPPDF